MNFPTLKSYIKSREIKDATRHSKPPTELSGSEWANEKRILSKEDSAEPGRYSTDRAPFQKEPLDAITNPYVNTVVLQWSSQIGKTLIATNIMGYYIDYEPSSIMYMTETIAKAENFSKARLDPMIRDNPWMNIERHARKSGNTVLEKFFPGGYLSIVGANSTAGLTSKPIRILIADEVDNYPLSSQHLGSPLDLAIQRTETYDNRKILIISSPGVDGISKVNPAFMESDQRYYYVPCLYCGEYQRLIWEQLKFPDKSSHEVYYQCAYCGEHLHEKDKFLMISQGEWRKTKPEVINKPGFHLSRLYSVFSPWSKMVEDFLKAKKQSLAGDNGPLQVFTNSSLAELWNPNTAPTSSGELIKRVENYSVDPLPKNVLLLTAGVDVQDDRIEVGVDGWALGEESYSITYYIIRGDPALDRTWLDLDEFLQKKWKHPSGVNLGLTCTCIDTGGHHTDQVYKFVRFKQSRRIYAIKGYNVSGKPAAPRLPSYNNKGKVPLYMIGTITIKDLIYSRLRITEPGPGYIHFHKDFCDEEYFEQLTAEAKEKTKSGFYYKQFPGRRNEVLDTKVYSYAALKIYNRDLRAVKNILERTAGTIHKPGERPKQQQYTIKKKPFVWR